MINLAVINLKDIFRFVKKIIILFFLIIIITLLYKKIFLNKYNDSSVTENVCIDYYNNNDLLGNYSNNSFISNCFKNLSEKIIKDTVLISKYNNSSELKKKAGIKRLLETEIAMFSIEEELMEKENMEEIIDFSNITVKNEENNIEEISQLQQSEFNNEIYSNQIQTNNVQNIPYHLDGKINSINNKKDTFTNIYNGVKIKNESSYILTEEMMVPNVELENKNDIIIYHTHTCESYTPTEENNYIASGNFRTIDLNYSVSRVGDELLSNLSSFGFNVIHNKNYHDYPAYTGSYARALTTINEIVSKNPKYEFIIDLHRDALSNSNYGPSVKLGDETVSQLMFVIGTDGGGLEHPDWLYNFKLAIKIQEKANEMYPGLFKPIILRNSRYNQHVSKGACIIEVGATGNTIEECNGSMKYLAKVINEVMK